MPRAFKLVLFATLALLAGAASALSMGGRAAADTNETGPDTSATPPEVMFKLAKGAWRARTDVPFVTFNMRERYTWRGHVHDNWWSGYYRDSDRDLVLHRMIVPEDEAARMRGFPIGIDIHFHKNPAHVDSFDTSASADAFPILDPLIEPNGSFGMLAHDSNASLAGNATAVPAGRPSATAAAATAVPAPAQSPSIFATEKPLRTLVRVEAVARDYAIAFVGTDKLESGDAYHLALTPLRDPQTFRLRDLWIDPSSYATLELGMQGLFDGKPYDDARWIVTYVQIGGRYYIRDIRAGDALRFGMDRTVSDLRFDFVGYDFPATIPETIFRRLL